MATGYSPTASRQGEPRKRGQKRRERRDAAWTNLEHTTLSERGQTPENAWRGTPLIGNVQESQFHRDRKWISGSLGEGVWREMRSDC